MNSFVPLLCTWKRPTNEFMKRLVKEYIKKAYKGIYKWIKEAYKWILVCLFYVHKRGLQKKSWKRPVKIYIKVTHTLSLTLSLSLSLSLSRSLSLSHTHTPDWRVCPHRSDIFSCPFGLKTSCLLTTTCPVLFNKCQSVLFSKCQSVLFSKYQSVLLSKWQNVFDAGFSCFGFKGQHGENEKKGRRKQK